MILHGYVGFRQNYTKNLTPQVKIHFRINHEQLFFLVLITRDRTSIEAIPIGCFSGTTLLIIHGADKSIDTEDYSQIAS